MSEGQFLNSKCIKMGCEEEGFQAFLTQPPLVNQFAIRFNGYPLTALRLQEELWTQTTLTFPVNSCSGSGSAAVVSNCYQLA